MRNHFKNIFKYKNTVTADFGNTVTTVTGRQGPHTSDMMSTGLVNKNNSNVHCLFFFICSI